MWTRTSWKKWLKITVTTVVACLFLVKFVSTSMQSAAGDNAGSETTAAVEASVDIPARDLI